MDWSHYRSALKPQIPDFPTDADHLHTLNFIQDAITNYLNSFHPLRPINYNKIKIKPQWWNKDIQQAIAGRKQAIFRFQNQMTQGNFINAQHQSAKVRRLIKRLKRDNWRRYSAEITIFTTPARHWRQVKWFSPPI